MVVSVKERGAFFTPRGIADYLTSWAIRTPHESVLDPGMGDGVFVLSSFERLTRLGASAREASDQTWGLDIDPESVETAAHSLRELGGRSTGNLRHGSFFDALPESDRAAFEVGRMTMPRFDAVVGNPPYIRYHAFRGEEREVALTRARAMGVEFPRLASSWAPFLVHSVRFLKPKGRLAMVLPAEILSVDYASRVRSFLVEQLGGVQILAFEDRVFPGVLEEVVLLLGEKDGESKHLEVKRLEGYPSDATTLQSRRVQLDQVKGNKWTRFLLREELDHTWSEALSDPSCLRLGDLAKVDIGVVTGNNNFFLLSTREAAENEISPEHLLPIVSTSRDLTGSVFGEDDFSRLSASEKKSWLLRLEVETDDVREYLSEGTLRGFATSYKCRGREPWFRVPSVYVPDFFISYMSSQFPRISANEAGATSTNTVHRGRIKQGRTLDLRLLCASFHNSLSFLSAELEGRSYGGGVLKHETKEAETIAIPDFRKLSKEDAHRIAEMTDLNLRQKKVQDVLDRNDEVLLEGTLHLNTRQVDMLRDGWESLRKRRNSRMRKTTTRKG